MPHQFAGIGTEPILPVKDIDASLAFYSGIGFGNGWAQGAPRTRAGLALDSARIQFALAHQGAISPQTVWIRLAGLEKYYVMVSDMGVAVLAEPKKQENGFVEFTISDPDGHQIIFAEAAAQLSLNRDGLDEIEIEYRKLTPEEHYGLSEAVGWGPFIYRPNVPEQIHRLTVTAVATHQGRLIGAASLAGDGRFIHIMGDVMVLPEYQGRGVGKKLINALDSWLKENAAKNAFVCLFASNHQSGYYRQFGFSGPETGFIGMSKVLVENSEE